jgi:excisionase family DNA binding protein
MSGQVLTPREAATVLGRSKSWIVERCQDGTLPSLRVGTRWLLKRGDLIRDGWLAPDRAHGNEAASASCSSVASTPADGGAGDV